MAQGYLSKLFKGRRRPEVQHLALLYNIFDGKGIPVVYPFIDKWYPFRIPRLELCILLNTTLSLKYE